MSGPSYAAAWDMHSPLDSDQAISKAILSSSSPQPPPQLVSQSPAALFLSSFASPPQSKPAPRPDDEGQVVAGYTFGAIIGYGASSVIRRAYSASGGVVAVKIVRRADLVKHGNAPLARRRLHHEATVWATLSHEHILPLFSAVNTSYADYFFTLYCPAGSLFDILKRDGSPALPQDDAGMMFRQVVRGLRYLHEVALYVHRDMKLENVLVDEMGVCRIGDFGMTRRIGTPDTSDEEDELEDCQDSSAIPTPNTPHIGIGASVHRAVSLAGPSAAKKYASHHHGSHSQQHLLHRHNTTRHRNSTSAPKPHHSVQPGSLPYAAPELLLPQTADVLSPHPAQDIWALGVMLYTMLTGRLPFSDSFEPRLQMKILNGTYEVPQGIGRGAERLLQGCLERNVTGRWTISMVDEVAWGVGWGAEGDAATPADEQDDFDFYAGTVASATHSNKHSQPPSRSRSRPPPELRIPDHPHHHNHHHSHHHPLLVHTSLSSAPSRSQSRDPSRHGRADNTNGWQTEERKPRSALDAASRRSSSRVKRSLSRAPLFSSTSSTGAGPGSTREHQSGGAGTITPPTSTSRSPSKSARRPGRLETATNASASSSRSRSRPPSPHHHHLHHLRAVPLSATSSSSAYSSSLVSPVDPYSPYSPLSHDPMSAPAVATTTTTPIPPAILTFERGRKPLRSAAGLYSPHSHSRSPSPSADPKTPLDDAEGSGSVMRGVSLMSRCLAKSLGLGHGSNGGSRDASRDGSSGSRERFEDQGEDEMDRVGVLADDAPFGRGRGITRRRAISIDSGAFVGI